EPELRLGIHPLALEPLVQPRPARSVRLRLAGPGTRIGAPAAEDRSDASPRAVRRAPADWQHREPRRPYPPEPASAAPAQSRHAHGRSAEGVDRRAAAIPP